MLDFETVTAMSREILRNHDRHLARSGRSLMRDRAWPGQFDSRLAGLPARIFLIIQRIARRTA